MGSPHRANASLAARGAAAPYGKYVPVVAVMVPALVDPTGPD
ncbi:hypothetical protein ACPFL9_18465 [Paenarthrobacter sp. NyZ202]